ncbi:lipoprotein [Mesoplasma seiffertii]|uniref:lipoprotein n=1 Tax=Mesoplasma seiffertii TaxID=28224 RepID=UPI00047E7E0A|nr:lipoprotein [Mesoplasma seiffertii]
MKKLLSLLGAVSLTATASLAVVACTNWTNYNNFENWVNETKVQYKGDTGEVVTKGSSAVIYIGAKDNASSLSFQAAVEEFLDPTGHDFNTGLKNLSTDNEDLGWNIKAASGALKNGYSDSTTWSTATVKKQTPKKKKAYWEKTKINEDQKYVVTKDKLEEKVTFNSIILDEMSQLWTSKPMKKIVSDVIEENIAKSLLSSNSNANADNKVVTENVNTILASLTDTKGPIFLTIRNGVITGFVNGFELFYEFNQGDSKAIDETLGTIEEAKEKRKTSLINLLSAIEKELNSNIEDHLLYNGSPTLNANPTGKAVFTTWDEGSSNFDKDKQTKPRPYQYSLSNQYLNNFKK